MNIRQLRYFCAVVELGSFSSAARDQGVSVQAVSKALVELETEMGRPLFIRDSKGAIPTSFGRELHEHALEALAAFDRVESFATSDAPVDSAPRSEIRLALAVPPFGNQRAVQTGLVKFLSLRMRAKVHLDICLGQEALPRLQAGSLDAIVTIGRYEDPDCDCLPVGTLPVGAFFAQDHPLAARKSVTLEDLAPYPVSYGAALDSFNETIVNLYRKHGLTSPVSILRTDAEAARFIHEEQGYSLAVGVAAFAPASGLAMRPIDPSQAVPVSVCLITVKGRATPQVEKLDRFMRKDFGRLAKMISRK